MTPDALFADLAAEQQLHADVTFGPVWHNDGLRVGGKVYAMLVRGELVVKVPTEYAADLVARGAGTPFEPSPGRLMREWVVVPAPASRRGASPWRRLMDAAREHVATVETTRPRRAKRTSGRAASPRR